MADYNILNEMGTFGNQPAMAQGNLTPEQQAYIEILKNTPQFTAPPAPVQPALRTQDAILGLAPTLILSLLGKGRDAEQYAKTYLGGKTQKAQMDTQVQNQNYEYQTNAKMQNYNRDLNVAKAGLDFTNQNEAKAYSRKMAEEAALEKEQKRLSGDVANAASLYDRSRDIGSMLSHARRWAEAERAMGAQIITAPTEEEVKQAWLQKSNQARNVIYDNWRQYVDSEKRGNYGTVPEAAASRLKGIKKQMEAELASYGITDAVLPDPPTEKSKELEYREDMLEEAKNKNVILKEKQDQSILESKARIQRMRERHAIELRGMSVSEFNANTARMNAELRREIQIGNNKLQSQIDRLQSQIVGKKKLAESEKSASAKRKLYDEITELAARRDYWIAKKEADPTVSGGTQTESTTPSVGTSILRTSSGKAWSPIN